MDNYKHEKEAFVSGMTGSSIGHINAISIAALVRGHRRQRLSRVLIAYSEGVSIALCSSSNETTENAPTQLPKLMGADRVAPAVVHDSVRDATPPPVALSHGADVLPADHAQTRGTFAFAIETTSFTGWEPADEASTAASSDNIPRAHDAHDDSRNPRSRLPSLSSESSKMRDVRRVSYGYWCRLVCILAGSGIGAASDQGPELLDGPAAIEVGPSDQEVFAYHSARSS